MTDDVATLSRSFLIVAAVLTAFAAFSFFSPLALRSEATWEETVLRAAAHFLPALPALIVGLAVRYAQVWAWYLGVFYMAVLFGLGVFLSAEHFVYIAHGNFIPPVFLFFSLLACPSLYFLLRRRLSVLKQLRGTV